MLVLGIPRTRSLFGNNVWNRRWRNGTCQPMSVSFGQHPYNRVWRCSFVQDIISKAKPPVAPHAASMVGNRRWLLCKERNKNTHEHRGLPYVALGRNSLISDGSDNSHMVVCVLDRRPRHATTVYKRSVVHINVHRCNHWYECTRARIYVLV